MFRGDSLKDYQERQIKMHSPFSYFAIVTTHVNFHILKYVHTKIRVNFMLFTHASNCS